MSEPFRRFLKPRPPSGPNPAPNGRPPPSQESFQLLHPKPPANRQYPLYDPLQSRPPQRIAHQRITHPRTPEVAHTSRTSRCPLRTHRARALGAFADPHTSAQRRTPRIAVPRIRPPAPRSRRPPTALPRSHISPPVEPAACSLARRRSGPLPAPAHRVLRASWTCGSPASHLRIAYSGHPGLADRPPRTCASRTPGIRTCASPALPLRIAYSRTSLPRIADSASRRLVRSVHSAVRWVLQFACLRTRARGICCSAARRVRGMRCGTPDGVERWIRSSGGLRRRMVWWRRSVVRLTRRCRRFVGGLPRLIGRSAGAGLRVSRA